MSQSSAATSQASTPTSAGQSSKQDALTSYCQRGGMRSPAYQVLSDRRGGRTAWSCTVQVGAQVIQARYWYDGQYVNNAREDAAEKALQLLGQIPAPPGPQATHYHQQQRAVYGTGAGAVGS